MVALESNSVAYVNLQMPRSDCQCCWHACWCGLPPHAWPRHQRVWRQMHTPGHVIFFDQSHTKDVSRAGCNSWNLQQRPMVPAIVLAGAALHPAAGLMALE